MDYRQYPALSRPSQVVEVHHVGVKLSAEKIHIIKVEVHFEPAIVRPYRVTAYLYEAYAPDPGQPRVSNTWPMRWAIFIMPCPACATAEEALRHALTHLNDLSAKNLSN